MHTAACVSPGVLQCMRMGWWKFWDHGWSRYNRRRGCRGCGSCRNCVAHRAHMEGPLEHIHEPSDFFEPNPGRHEFFCVSLCDLCKALCAVLSRKEGTGMHGYTHAKWEWSVSTSILFTHWMFVSAVRRNVLGVVSIHTWIRVGWRKF